MSKFIQLLAVNLPGAPDGPYLQLVALDHEGRVWSFQQNPVKDDPNDLGWVLVPNTRFIIGETR